MEYRNNWKEAVRSIKKSCILLTFFISLEYVGLSDSKSPNKKSLYKYNNLIYFLYFTGQTICSHFKLVRNNIEIKFPLH